MGHLKHTFFSVTLWVVSLLSICSCILHLWILRPFFDLDLYSHLSQKNQLLFLIKVSNEISSLACFSEDNTFYFLSCVLILLDISLILLRSSVFLTWRATISFFQRNYFCLKFFFNTHHMIIRAKLSKFTHSKLFKIETFCWVSFITINFLTCLIFFTYIGKMNFITPFPIFAVAVLSILTENKKKILLKYDFLLYDKHLSCPMKCGG